MSKLGTFPEKRTFVSRKTRDTHSGGAPFGMQVHLLVYDLSMGTASQLASAVLGIQVDLIPHTAILVFEQEHYFSGGMQATPPGQFEQQTGYPFVQVEVPEKKPSGGNVDSGANGFPINEIILRFDKMMHGRSRMEKREMPLKDAKPILTELESEKLVSEEEIKRQAVWSAEQEGIVFIDEIDKICSRGDYRGSADASSEGVQRDLLPLLEGSQVSTKIGNINTDHILFIASGAFHYCKPSDLLAELQGRLPIRVELKNLTEKDMYTILTEPENNLVNQQCALMFTEGVQLDITDDAKWRIATLASQINRDVENIGARRLHTIMERLLEDLSFAADERAGEKVTIKAEDVQKAVGELAKKSDLSKFIL